jgi:hypothetical protein
MSQKDREMVHAVAPHVRSERGKQNVFYWTRAVDALIDDDRFAWLCSRNTASTGAWKTSILAELGRFQDEDDIRFLAQRICTERMKTKDAVRYLQQIRALVKRDAGGAA